MGLSIIDYVTYPDKSLIVELADQGLMPLRIALKGQKVTLSPKGNSNDEEITQLYLRTLAGLVALLLLPVTLGAVALKRWYQEWQVAWITYHHFEEGEYFKIKEKSSEIDRSEFIDCLQREIEQLQSLEVELGEPKRDSWREYGKKVKETNQTFEEYTRRVNQLALPNTSLQIQLLGTFSDTDRKILRITCDFLNIFHCLPQIRMEQDALKIKKLKEKYSQAVVAGLQQIDSHKKRRIKVYNEWHEKIAKGLEKSFPREDGKYDGALLLELLESTKDRKEKLIAFTDHDLFIPELSNFVFGCAQGEVGVWSNHRFGNPRRNMEAFKTCLLRMMKISTHEFGHMRGIRHCVNYECNIGGYISRKELDERPLFYCVQDMAKIALLTQTSLLELHQNLLEFFQTFPQKYGFECDFNKEIKVIKARIAKLTG